MINSIGSDEQMVWNIFSERTIVKDFPIPCCCISTTQCYSFLPLIFNCVTHHNCNIHDVVNWFCVTEQIAVWYLRRYDSFIHGHNNTPVAMKQNAIITLYAITSVKVWPQVWTQILSPTQTANLSSHSKNTAATAALVH